MISYIFNNWQFFVTLFIALAALIIGIEALRSSRRIEVPLVGDEPSVMVTWNKGGNQTICNLHAFGEVEKVSVKVGKTRNTLNLLQDINRTQTIQFPLIERGTHWEIRFVDPATGKTLRQTGLVRYD